MLGSFDRSRRAVMRSLISSKLSSVADRQAAAAAVQSADELTAGWPPNIALIAVCVDIPRSVRPAPLPRPLV